MVYLLPSQFDSAYQQIKADCGSSIDGCSLLVFIAADVDAICASRILSFLLKTDFVQFKLVPVCGYDDIAKANEDFVQGSSQFKSIIFLNCGATINISEFLSLSDTLKVYVIDSHRPFSLENIFASDQIYVFDDGDLNIRDLFEAFQACQEPDSESEEDTEEGQQQLDQEEEKENSPDSHSSSIPNAQKERGFPKKSRREKRSDFERILKNHYQGTWFGQSAAGLVYSLATKLARPNNDLLWDCIVGLTDQFLFDRISKERYFDMSTVYSSEVTRFNSSDTDFEDDAANPSASEGLASATFHGRIKAEDELKFMFLRHWTLYNSIFHSTYVATKMGVWRDKGKKRLETMLAKMGIPLQQSSQLYAYMSSTIKRSLSSQLEKFAEEFGLSNEDLLFPSFTRQYGYKIKISAADVVYGVTALLEAPVDLQSSIAKLAMSSTKNFFAAIDALDPYIVVIYTGKLASNRQASHH